MVRESRVGVYTVKTVIGKFIREPMLLSIDMLDTPSNSTPAVFLEVALVLYVGWLIARFSMN
jgi:hypothetical protein